MPSPAVDWLRTARRHFIDHADPTPDLFAYARENALDLDALLALDVVLGLMPCAFQANGHFYFPVKGGERAAVIEARGRDDATVVDLIGWPVDDANTFATFFGAPLLGMTKVSNPATWALGGTLRLFRSPLTWLREVCDGAVILDHRIAPLWLRDVPEITCENLEHARFLKSLLIPKPFDRKRIKFFIEGESP